MIVNDCVTFPTEENRPLHVDRGMKSFCLLQSAFPHFCLQTVSPLCEYQVTSAPGWLPAKLHLGYTAQQLRLSVTRNGKKGSRLSKLFRNLAIFI